MLGFLFALVVALAHAPIGAVGSLSEFSAGIYVTNLASVDMAGIFEMNLELRSASGTAIGAVHPLEIINAGRLIRIENYRNFSKIFTSCFFKPDLSEWPFDTQELESM
jgi:hypothetical protein